MRVYLFDKNQKSIGRLPSDFLITAEYTEQINTAGQLLFEVPSEKRLDGSVVYVAIQEPKDSSQYLLFKLIQEQIKDYVITYTAVEAAYDELSAYSYVQDKRPTADLSFIAKEVLDGTRWTLGNCPSTPEAHVNFYYLSILDCLKKMVETFSVEINFHVEINGETNEITDRKVNFYLEQGQRTNKRFEYGSNLLSVMQEENTQNIYTALVGRGKGEEKQDNNGDGDPDGYGRRITFADVEWSKSNGDPLDKPKGQEWIEDPEATAALGFSDGHMRIGLTVFEDITDPDVLLQETYKALKASERPQVQFSASPLDVGDLGLGDTVAIIRHDVEIQYLTRVFKIQHNLLDKTRNKIELGDNLAKKNSITYQISNIKNDIDNHQQQINIVTGSANGKNDVYFSSETPETGKDGDVWYKDLGNGEQEMYVYHNGWQLIISTQDVDKIKKEVEQHTKDISSSIDAANSAVEKADGLVSQIGEANTNAQRALDTANQNKSDLEKAKADIQSTNGQLAGAMNSISQAQKDIESTQQSLKGVQSDLSNTNNKLDGLTKKAQEQGDTIVEVQKEQAGLSADVADVKGNVSSLEETTSSLQAAVKDNQGNISQLKSTANGLQSSVQNNKNDISNIRQTANKVQSTVSNMQNAGQNLIVNSDFKQGSYHWNLNGWTISKDRIFRNNKIISKTQSGLSSANYNELSATDLIPVQKGQKISIGVWVKANDVDSSGEGNKGALFGVNWYADDHSGRNHWDDYWAQENIGNHDWRFLKLEGIKVPDDSNFVRAHFFLTQNGTAQFALPIMVYGDTLPAWSPSPFDLASQNDVSSIKQTLTSITTMVQSHTGDISQLRQKADSLTSQIGNANNDISSLKQRADSLESNISNVNNDVSSLRQTANSLQSNIQSKADVSQVTQMADVLQSTVGAIGAFLPNGSFTETQLDRDYMPWDTTKSWDAFQVVTDNPDWGHYMQLHGFPGTVQKIITKDFIRINPNASVIYTGQSLVSWTDPLNGSFIAYIHFYDINKSEINIVGAYYKYDNNNTLQDFRIEITPPENAMYIRIESVVDASKSSTDIWCALKNLAVQNGDSSLSSKITQMQGDINLRVQKGDLISQINIEAGKTLIQSKNIYLDSDTVTFSGRAFIPSAAITDLSADKITTGTLNAANVNVINMNVDNLVGDTTSFVKSQWNNAYGSNVTIDGEGMSIHYGDWDTKFNSGGVNFNIGGNDIGGFSVNGMSGMPDWYQGLALTTGAEAEFFSISAKDYHNANQNPIPPKLIWMRGDINGAGYNPGWNFLDDVWTNKIGIGSIQYQNWNIHFGIVTGENGFTALTLVSGNGAGFYWGSDGSFGFVVDDAKLYNVRYTQLINNVGSDGVVQNWTPIS